MCVAMTYALAGAVTGLLQGMQLASNEVYTYLTTVCEIMLLMNGVCLRLADWLSKVCTVAMSSLLAIMRRATYTTNGKTHLQSNIEMMS